MKNKVLNCGTFICLLLLSTQFLKGEIIPVNFSKVTINDPFWTPKINKVATVTLKTCINYTENKTGRIRNFENVPKKANIHEGIFFDDSDVYKAIEAIAYSLKNNPDVLIEKKADEWIDKIAAAQESDGYINTYYSITGLQYRWTDMDKHEDYCAGHLLEAGLAYYNTTGKRKLLDVAIGMVNHIDVRFRGQNIPWITGHEELELALVKLYHATNEKRYLDLAEWLIEQRGRGHYKGFKRESLKYDQNDIPFVDQRKVEGHAVRAMYLYTGAADVAASKNDTRYMPSLLSIWDNLVGKNLYITGGIGSSGHNEGFTTDYDLPNESAYCETCASVGMILWNQRMNSFTGDAKYIDVLEKSLYNSALSGLAFSGNRFFYGNPLASSGQNEREEWFGVACCPSNISRLVSSLGNYIYAASNDGVYVNLFISSKTDIPLKNNTLGISQKTEYPWKGLVTITLSPKKKVIQKLFVRIPGWVQGKPIPSDLYSNLLQSNKAFTITLNGKNLDYKIEKGYAIIEKEWKKGDVITLDFPMEIQKVISNVAVKDNANRVALQRGPLVYCFEHIDNNGKAKNIIIPDNTTFTSTQQPDLIGGIVTLSGNAPVVDIKENGISISTETKEVTAIPYFAWANRGKGEMQIWMLRQASGIK